MIVEGKAEGELNVNNVLNIKSEGNVNGKIFYGEILFSFFDKKNSQQILFFCRKKSIKQKYKHLDHFFSGKINEKANEKLKV